MNSKKNENGIFVVAEGGVELEGVREAEEEEEDVEEEEAEGGAQKHENASGSRQAARGEMKRLRRSLHWRCLSISMADKEMLG